MYYVGIGYDVPSLDLALIDPQPSSQGVQVTKRYYAGDGSVTDEGLFVELEFSALKDAVQYRDLLVQFNILSYTNAPVTIMARAAAGLTSLPYNGIAVQPEIVKDLKWNFMPRSVTILVKNLVVLGED